MSWVTEISARAWRSYTADVEFMNAKNERVYRRLVTHIMRFGSAPDDLIRLGQIVGVTPGYFRDSAWPILADFFEVHEGRLFHRDTLRASRRKRFVPVVVSRSPS